MTKKGIEANLEVIAHNIFEDCVSDIEQYITDGIYNKQLSSESTAEFLIMQNNCLKLFADRVMLYTRELEELRKMP